MLLGIRPGLHAHRWRRCGSTRHSRQAVVNRRALANPVPLGGIKRTATAEMAAPPGRAASARKAKAANLLAGHVAEWAIKLKRTDPAQDRRRPAWPQGDVAPATSQRRLQGMGQEGCRLMQKHMKQRVVLSEGGQTAATSSAVAPGHAAKHSKMAVDQARAVDSSRGRGHRGRRASDKRSLCQGGV